MKVDKEPLWDEDDTLLGYSCRATVNMYAVAEALRLHTEADLRYRMGINKESKGVTWDKDIRDRRYIFEWFQPTEKDIL